MFSLDEVRVEVQQSLKRSQQFLTLPEAFPLPDLKNEILADYERPE